MIKSDFNYLRVSIFFSNVLNIKEAINKVYKNNANLFDTSKVSYITEDDIKIFINPKSGASHKPEFIIFENTVCEGKVFFLSNYEDGLINLTANIAKNANCELIDVLLSGVSDYPKFMYRKIYKQNERYVCLLKDSKWEFIQKGEPINYERLDIYSEKNVTSRLSNELIYEYLFKEGIIINESIVNNFKDRYI